MFEPLVLQKKLSFSHNTSINNNVVLHSDYLKTKQIISNILSNAIKYTTKGNISFNISYQNDLLNIEITDTGAGIPQDKIHSIYDAFSRVEENNVLSKGSGFGLYIVKNFVNILQGEISTVSTVGKGTSIKITIPAKSVIVAIKDMPCHIAIIDDDIPFLTMLKEMLSLMGHHVNTCTSLEELEDLLKAQDYDFLLTDMEMGTFTGKDVLKTVKSKAFTIPVIVISGRSDFNKEKTSEIGFDGYLQKPVTMESLQQFFCNVCSSHSGSGKIHELLNVDIEAAKKIWALFIESTVENIALLEQAVETNDFKKAKSICHKMQPMFLQLHFDNAAIILRKIDIAQESNFKWQDDIAALIDICKKVIQQENIVF